MITHQELVEKLVKPGITIKEEVTARELVLWCLSINLVIQSSKILDLIKKRVVYRKDLNEQRLLEEMSKMEESGAWLYTEITHPAEEVQLSSYEELRKKLTPIQFHMLHMFTGVAGEAGELFEALMDNVIHGKDININNIVEEEGDSEFYHEAIRQIFNLTRELILNKNIEKLATGKNARYKDAQYSDKAAQERKDKEEDHTQFPGEG